LGRVFWRGQTVQIWSALFAAAILVGLVGLAQQITLKRMGVGARTLGLGALGFWAVNVRLARLDTTCGLRLFMPALFALPLPAVILPPPSAIGARIAASLPILRGDFVQTFVKGAPCAGLRCGDADGHRHRPLVFPAARAAAGGQFHSGGAHCRHRADPHDVVRLRLAVRGGGVVAMVVR